MKDDSTEVVPALGHIWEDWEIITPPTYDTEGLEQHICIYDRTHVETRPVARLEKPSEDNDTSAGADSSQGSEGQVQPGSVTAAQNEPDALPGSYNVGFGTVSVQNNTVTVVTPVNKKAKSLNIPNSVMIQGRALPVTAIAPNAFKGMKKLKSVTIGENIQSIGKNAFKNCANLKKITIKSLSLEKSTVGANAFRGINPKAVVKCPKSKKKEYRKFLIKKGMKKTVRFR